MRAEFTEQCAELMEAVIYHMPLDGVADLMAVQFLQQRLPPPPLRKVRFWWACGWGDRE